MSDPHRETLERTISFRDYLAIGIGVMIGVGWVIYAGQWLQSGGSAGAALAFLIGGLLHIPIIKCYGELTSAMPVSGGAIAFTLKAFGPTVAFMAGWALSLMYISTVPFETIAVGAMVEAILPSITSHTLYEIKGYSIAWSSIVPGVLTGLWITWINWKGARDTVRFQTLVVSGLVICTVVFCSMAFWKGDLSNFQPLFVGEGSLFAVAAASIFSVIVVVPFFLAGIDCIPQTAEESGLTMKPRQLGVALLVTVVVGVCFNILIILALAYSVSGKELAAIMSEKSAMPMAEVFRHNLGHEWAAKVVLIAALLGLVSTLNSVFIAATRLLFALGRGGFLPEWFAQLHPVYHSPKNAIFVVGVLAVLGPFIGKAGLSHIVNSTSLIIAGVYFVVTCTCLRLRHTSPDLNRPYKINLSTIWFAIAVSALLIGLMVIPGSPGQVSLAEFSTVVGWMVVGLCIYFYQRNKENISQEERALMILGDYQ